MTLELAFPPDRPFKLLQLSDCHFLDQVGETLMGVDTEQSFQTVLEALRVNPQWPADLILLTGDLVQNPSPSAYQRLRHRLETLEIPWICLPGNHDDPALMAAVLCQDGDHCCKRILTGRWQILCIDSHMPDSHVGHLPLEELAFLDRWTGDSSLFTLVALHHPPLPVGSTWMDTMQVDNSRAFFRILDGRHQVKGVIFGHIHQIFCTRHRHIPLWSVPSTCFQFKPNSKDFALDDLPPGWRWLELDSHGHIRTWVERLDHRPKGVDLSSSGY